MRLVKQKEVQVLEEPVDPLPFTVLKARLAGEEFLRIPACSSVITTERIGEEVVVVGMLCG